MKASIPPICDDIRHAIVVSDTSCYQLWQRIGCSKGHLSEFMAETKGLSVDTLEKLVACPDLEITTRPMNHSNADRKDR